MNIFRRNLEEFLEIFGAIFFKLDKIEENLDKIKREIFEKSEASFGKILNSVENLKNPENINLGQLCVNRIKIMILILWKDYFLLKKKLPLFHFFFFF